MSSCKVCGMELPEGSGIICDNCLVEANTVYNKTGEKADQNHLAEELADIIICVLTASAEEEIDIERAINEAMLKNARRAYGTEN